MQSAVPFRLGGHVALDFVNTVNSWTQPVVRDDFATFRQVVVWSAEVGLIQPCEVEKLVASDPLTAKQAHDEAIALRGLLLRLFGSVIDGVEALSSDLERLNDLLSEARAGQRFKRVGVGTRFEWTWTHPVEARTPVMLLALHAAELLETVELGRLKRCPPPDGCGWLFLDESRNRSRRWCSMDFCGSRAKARRFAAAHKLSG